MNIGEQRRTVYVEPIEEPPDDPILEPRREAQPTPAQPARMPEPSKSG
jgi:hypothetical protein